MSQSTAAAAKRSFVLSAVKRPADSRQARPERWRKIVARLPADAGLRSRCFGRGCCAAVCFDIESSCAASNMIRYSIVWQVLVSGLCCTSSHFATKEDSNHRAIRVVQLLAQRPHPPFRSALHLCCRVLASVIFEVRRLAERKYCHLFASNSFCTGPFAYAIP